MKKENINKSYRRVLNRSGVTLRNLHTKHNRTSKAKLFKCPKCEVSFLKRISAGIWNCKKCEVSFSGNSYSF